MKNKTISAVTSVMAVIALAEVASFIMLAVLRLCNIINWSWWLVTAPLWGGTLLLISIFISTILFMLASAFVIRDRAVKEFKAKKGEPL